MKPRLLIIDDEKSICVSLSLALSPHFDVTWVTDPDHGLELLRRQGDFSLLILDLVIGERDGLEVLQAAKEMDSEIAVIVMTAYGSIRSSVSAMKAGAFTYLSKPLDIEELMVYIGQALEFRSLNQRVSYLSDVLNTRDQFFGMIGQTHAMQEIYRMIEKLKDVDASVTISGDSGTGKELVAKAIHFSGKRKHHPFVAVNCAAIPEGLLEGEFFGHKRGSFTGAVGDSRGKFEIAHKGTLFFDEIGDMPLNLQGKLLRALQEKAYTPIGSHEIKKFDVRVIAATNQDLKTMVEEGRFRQDLYYRINVVEIQIPPLRERKQDIPLLCKHFIRTNTHNSSIKGLTKGAERILLEHHYPGNVRELFNILEYASIVCNGEWIDVSDLPPQLPIAPEKSPHTDHLGEAMAGLTLKELEQIAITASFHRNKGSRKSIAEELNISQRGLWNKLREYGLS